ncbi:NAD(P)-binding protein [Thozetella sp. PMI_491]|nr:NAD(P)-binding protein [Thozetella sp. PMI_491]
MPQKFDRLSKGDLILVTGVSGLVGSSVAEAALHFGFRVRGVTRDRSKLTELHDKLVSQFGQGQFETVEVADITKPELYTPHLQGVAAVAHIATDSTLQLNPQKVIDAAVESTVGLMKEAAKVASVKVFVLTSSRVAAFMAPSSPEELLQPTEEAWFDAATEQALSVPKDHPALPFLGYVASKVEGEKAAWDYYRTAKPQYAFSAILPDYVLGTPGNPRKGNYSTYSAFMGFYDGSYNPEDFFYVCNHPPSLFIGVEDTALIHVIALAASEVNEERIFAMTDTYSVSEMAAIIRNLKPGWKAPASLSEENVPRRKIAAPNARFVELIKKYGGRPPTTLEEAIEKTINGERR